MSLRKDQKMYVGITVLMFVLIGAFGWWMKTRTPPLDTKEQKLSYALGRQLGESALRQSLPIDHAALTLGVQDAIREIESPIDLQEARQELMKDQLARVQAALGGQAAVRQAKMLGDKFLATNRKNEDVRVMASGLHYESISKGNGSKPKDGDVVEVRLHGSLVDGKKLNPSADAEVKLTVGNTTPEGLSEALRLMTTGSKSKIALPPHLAYGATGLPPEIPGESVIIYEIELLKINSGAAPKASSTE